MKTFIVLCLLALTGNALRAQGFFLLDRTNTLHSYQESSANHGETWYTNARGEQFVARSGGEWQRVVSWKRTEEELQAAKQGFDVVASPNPTSSTTLLSFRTSQPSTVSAELYNALGERVVATQSVALSAGLHSFSLDCNALPSGTYYYVVRANGERINGSIAVMK